jgi:hypothetical protein
VDNHWGEWRLAVARSGYTPALQRASRLLEELDQMTPYEVEAMMRSIQQRRVSAKSNSSH